MARGKHKTKSSGRQSGQQSASILQLQEELAMEQEALVAAQGAMAAVAQLQVDLDTERSAAEPEIAPLADQLRRERDYLRSVFSEAKSQHAKVFAAWDKFAAVAIDVSPGKTNLEQIEQFGAAIGMPAWIADENRGLSAEQATRIQRARGDRRSASSQSHEAQQMGNLLTLLNVGSMSSELIMPQYRQALLDQGVVSVDEDGVHEIVPAESRSHEQQQALDHAIGIAQRIANARAGELDALAVHAWGSSPLVAYRPRSGPALDALGWAEETAASATRISEEQPASIGLPLPGTTAAARAALVGYGPERILAEWRDAIAARKHVVGKLDLDSRPFAAVKPHPHPGQALATQTAYEVAAYAHWLGDRSASKWGESAVGLSTAAAYWLPAGQTASFAESEPLSEDDRSEMVLPFPNVFLAFAEPLVLDRAETPSVEEKHCWESLSQISHDALRNNQTIGDLIGARSRVKDGWDGLGLEQMITKFGAQIEGVLLLGDALGRPDDSFAWCLAIRGSYGVSLGRFVVPASRAETKYRDVIDNLTAVVAWAQWHEPDQGTEVPLGIGFEDLEALTSTPAFKREGKRAGAGIRVVNVGSTHRTASSRRDAEVETDNHVSPHIRRGHWRRQRFGPRLEGSKRIRIAPVLVNAHRGDVAPRVYRLRQRSSG